MRFSVVLAASAVTAAVWGVFFVGCGTERCTKDSDCAAGRICGSGGSCISNPFDNFGESNQSTPERVGLGGSCSGDFDCRDSVCDPSSNECVKCYTDSHCSSSRPACYNNQCVRCTSDAHCPSSSPQCVGRECRHCRGGSGDAWCQAEGRCRTSPPAGSCGDINLYCGSDNFCDCRPAAGCGGNGCPCVWVRD